MEASDNLKEAIRELTATGAQITVPRMEEVPYYNDRGERLTVPVAFLADGQAKVRAVSLLDMVKEARAHADENRLSTALGPDRRKGTAFHHTLGSFLQHVERFRDDGTAIWINRGAETDDGEECARLVAIFNYHQQGAGGAPRWGDHCATYEILTSKSWDQWGGGKPLELGADDLAEFLEAHDYQLAQGTLPSGTVAPPPSFLLTMADKLDVYSSATMRKERDPNTGKTKLLFTEEKGATLGDTAPPSAFLISIPVFEDSKEPVTAEVRMRVIVQDKKAVFKLWIHDAARLFEKEMNKLRDEVVNASKVAVFSGIAE